MPNPILIPGVQTIIPATESTAPTTLNFPFYIRTQGWEIRDPSGTVIAYANRYVDASTHADLHPEWDTWSQFNTFPVVDDVVQFYLQPPLGTPAGTNYEVRADYTADGFPASAFFDVGSTASDLPTANLTGPATACTGTAAILTYNTANATSVSISGGVGSVTPNTSGTVSTGALTAGTHTFTLTATGAGGTSSSTVTIVVADCGSPNTCTATGLLTFAPPAVSVTCALQALPSPIGKGETSTLLLTTTGARFASLDHGLGPLDLSGTGTAAADVSPAVTTPYTAVAEGAWRTQAHGQATVTVTRPVLAQTCDCAWTPQPSPTSPGWTQKDC